MLGAFCRAPHRQCRQEIPVDLSRYGTRAIDGDRRERGSADPKLPSYAYVCTLYMYTLAYIARNMRIQHT